MPNFHPHVLRDYALIADGERGALVSPRGDIVWLCAPRWHSGSLAFPGDRRRAVVLRRAAGLGLVRARRRHPGRCSRGGSPKRPAGSSATGRPPLALPADVSDYGQVHEAARQAGEFFGPIDVWINVAFTSAFSPFAEISPEEFRRVTEVSYLGFVHGTMAALALMRPRGRGTLVAGKRVPGRSRR